MARWLVHFGLPLVGANLIGPAVAAVDVAAIGRILGPIPLGSYQLANNVAAWPLALFLPVLVNIGFPPVSRYREDRSRLGPVLRHVSLLPPASSSSRSRPCSRGWPQSWSARLYGSKWAASGPVLAVLGVYAAIRVILALVSDVLVALDATKSLLLYPGRVGPGSHPSRGDRGSGRAARWVLHRRSFSCRSS